MNKEIEKAMMGELKNKELEKKIKATAERILFYPLNLVTKGINKIYDKFYKYFYSRNRWDEERAKNILTYYIAHKAKWNEDTKSFYFFDNGMGWYMKTAKKYLRFKDRNFWKFNGNSPYSTMRAYLINSFELEGFIKNIINKSDGYTEINFKLK